MGALIAAARFVMDYYKEKEGEKLRIAEWERQLQALRQGELQLEPTGESGLTDYASTALYELRQYVAALEQGYRVLSGIIRGYRRKERSGEVTGILGLLENQWSKPAALGYAAMAFRQSGMTPDQTVGLLELVEEFMDEFSLAEAGEYYRGMLDDPGGQGKNELEPEAEP